MELDLSLKNDRMPKRTPVEAKKLVCVTCEYEDGSKLELPIELEQGFHRVSEHVGGGKRLIMHEIFLTYGQDE